MPHYDHTGGLPEVLKVRGEIEVHAHPNLFFDRIALPKEKSGERTLYMGIPYEGPTSNFSVLSSK